MGFLEISDGGDEIEEIPGSYQHLRKVKLGPQTVLLVTKRQMCGSSA